MAATNEAFSRVRIDAQLRDQGWDVLDISSVRFEYVLPDRTQADYVLCDRNGRALAVIEAKKAAMCFCTSPGSLIRRRRQTSPI
jgi:type I restriction enzyme R subunit